MSEGRPGDGSCGWHRGLGLRLVERAVRVCLAAGFRFIGPPEPDRELLLDL